MDFRKSEFETYETELAVLYGEINTAIKKIKTWSKPKKVKTNLANFPGRSYIFLEPYGNTLVIGAWNYPFLLSLSPLVSAIAAGNTVILKPSEISINSSHVMANLLNETFAAEYIHVFEGGVEISTALLDERWNYIFFTGSPQVGKIVYQAAAKNITPVTLELGGKSPAIVFEDANLKMAAKRICWGKFLNAGQTCIAPDYLLVSTKIKDNFLELLISEIKNNYGENPSKSDAFTSIINNKNFERLRLLLNSGNIFYGGNIDKDDSFIAPTIICPTTFDDEIMQQEIFGPLLPIIEFESEEDFIPILKDREKPLALYVFTNLKTKYQKIIDELSFGGGVINDTVVHFANPMLPFGGVGNSGIGSYHGVDGFKTFSHKKSILKKGRWFDPFVKYPPYSDFKKKLLSWILE